MNFDLSLIGGFLISALVTAERPVALGLLQSFHDKNVHDYKALVFLANSGIRHAQDAASTTNTTLDDQALAALLEIVTASASQNGITI